MKYSLPVKFAWSISIIILLTSLLLSLTFLSNQIQTMEKNLLDKGLTLVKTFADNSEFGLRFYNKPQLESMASNLLRQDDVVYTTITDEKNRLFVDRRSGNGPPLSPDDKFPKFGENQDAVYRLLVDRETGHEVYHFSARIFSAMGQSEAEVLNLLSEGAHAPSARKVIGTAHLGLSLDSMRTAIGEARRKLVLLTSGIVLAGILTAVLLSMYVTRPIKKLVHATQQIADGNLKFTLQEETRDEIGELAHSFNKMIQTLEQTMVSRDFAEQANTAKSEFLANMSHELRTPVHSILSFADLGIEKIDRASKEKLADYFQEIDQSGKILLQLLNSLLDLAKLEAGKMEFKFEETDLSMLIRSVMVEFNLACSEQNLHMEFQCLTPDNHFVVDPDKIRQVIRNILANAVKYSPEGGRIKLELEVEDGVALVCIGDEGIGIPRDELESIFEKFVQSSKTKTGAGGTGLGLSICREIIEKHEGRIWADHQTEGGARFFFELPTQTNTLTPAKAKSTPGPRKFLEK